MIDGTFDSIDNWQERHPLLALGVSFVVGFGVLFPLLWGLLLLGIWILQIMLGAYVGRVLFNVFGSI